MPEAVAIAALLAVHGASLTSGQLRGDDFQFLREAREPIGDTLLRPWGGHVFPLWRLEALAAYHVWGLDPVPFRWWLLAQVAVVAVLTLRVLAAWGVGTPGRTLAAVMLGAWAQWSQVLSGYWTLSISVKVWAFTLVAVLGVLHEGPAWVRRGLVAAGVLLAVLEDPAGAIVIPAVAGALLVARPTPPARRAPSALPEPPAHGATHVRDPVTGWSIAMLLVALGVVAMGQAAVRASGSQIADLAAYGGGTRLTVMAFLLGPVVVGSTLAPSLVAIIPRGVATIAAWALSAVVVLAIALAWRRAGSRRPAVAHAALMLAAGIALVGATRAYGDFRFMALWTHYVMYAFLPVVALAGAAADAWWNSRVVRGRHARTRLVAVGAAYAVAQLGGGAVASRLRLMGAPGWELQMARGRAVAYATIADSVLEPLAAAVPMGGTVLQLPSQFLDARFPREHPFFPLSFYSELGGERPGRFVWVTPPMPTWVVVSRRDGIVVADPRPLVDPAFVRVLGRAGWVRDLYFWHAAFVAEAELPVACDVARRRGGAVAVRSGHRLLFDVPAPGPDSVRFDAQFTTSFRPAAEYGVTIPPGLSGCVSLDLRRVPELALSDTVRFIGATGAPAGRVTSLGMFPPRP